MTYHSDNINVYRGLFTAFAYPIEIKRLSKLIQLISYNLYRIAYAKVYEFPWHGVEAMQVCRLMCQHQAGCATTAIASPTPFYIWTPIKKDVPKPRLYFICSPLRAHFSSEFCKLAKKCSEKLWRRGGWGG